MKKGPAWEAISMERANVGSELRRALAKALWSLARSSGLAIARMFQLALPAAGSRKRPVLPLM
jgi:hypothetical protein